MGADGSFASGGARIVAGIGVFIIAWIIQATMGDSSMFSMEYRSGTLFQDLLVNMTFWPGWVFTIGLIGSGVLEVFEVEDAGEPESNASEVGRGPAWSTTNHPQPTWPPSESQMSPTVGHDESVATERTNPAPGWYADPAGSEALRYWDGRRWGSELRTAPDRF
jgi:hypothetical protein